MIEPSHGLRVDYEPMHRNTREQAQQYVEITQIYDKILDQRYFCLKIESWP